VRTRTAVTELPWVVAACLGSWWIARTAFTELGVPAGSDWGIYLKDAAAIWLPDSGMPFNDWRRPLHGYLVGWLGAERSYVEAARLIAAWGGVATVWAAAIAGRALSGPGVAILAAASVPFVPVTVDAAHWTNHYGLLGALVGLAIAAGACSCRWGSAVAALGAGLLAGAAMALDLRGLAGAGTAAGLVLLGVFAPVSWWRRLLLPAAFVAAVAAVSAWHDHLVAIAGLSSLPFDEQVRIQRALTLQAIRLEGGGPGGALNACLDLSATSMTLAGLQEPCSRALFASNIQRLAVSLPPVAWLLALAPALLPARWGWRSTLAGLGVLVAPVLAMLVGLAWVLGQPRYLTPLAVSLVLLAPLAAARVAERSPRLVGLGLWALAVFAVTQWPGVTADREAWPSAPSGRPEGLASLAERVLDQGSADPIVDCGGSGLEVFALPEVVDLRALVGSSPGRCLVALEDLATGGQPGWGITLLRKDAASPGIVLSQDAVEALGFERALVVGHGMERFALWRIE